jgi:type 1 glutamine amidotransferase
MRFFRLCLVVAASLLGGSASDAVAEDDDIRILLTYGGHGFQEETFFGMFEQMEGIEYTKAKLPDAADMLKPGLEKNYDVVVMYDMVRAITPEQQEQFKALLEKGIGLVSLHHNLGAHRDWPEFAKIIGGKYMFAAAAIDGEPHGKSGYSHGENLQIAVADKTHPISRELKDFEIEDETYNNFYSAKGVKVLLTTDNPKNDPEIAWVKQYGNSRVFYFMLGHDAKAWRNEAYPEVVERGIRWAAGE